MENLSYENLKEGKGTIAFRLLKEKVAFGKTLNFKVANDYSMSPLLNQDDIVSVRKVEFQDLQRGDIIVYRINEHLCVHRYIRTIRSHSSNGLHKPQKDNDSFKLVTKGDNLSNFDRWLVSSEELFGRVVSIKKKHVKISLESFFWKTINYILTSVSYFQVYGIKFCRRLKRFFFENKNLFLDPFLKKLMLSFLSAPLRFTLVASLSISYLCSSKKEIDPSAK